MYCFDTANKNKYKGGINMGDEIVETMELAEEDTRGEANE